MSRTTLPTDYGLESYPDFSVNLDDQYRQLVADILDDEGCGDLLAFDDGAIRALPADPDDYRFQSDGTIAVGEDLHHAQNMTGLLLMSNAPGHGPILELDEGCGIQPIYEFPVTSYSGTPMSASPHEISPYEFFDSAYHADMCTPSLSPPSSISSATSSLPAGTPPPGLSMYPPGFYDASTGDLPYLPYTPYQTGHDQLHQGLLYIDSFDGRKIAPEDSIKDWQGPSYFHNDFAPPDDYRDVSISPPATIVHTLEDPQLHYEVLAPSPASSPRSTPIQLDPTLTSTPSVRLWGSISSVPASEKDSGTFGIDAPSIRHRLRSKTKVPIITTKRNCFGPTPTSVSHIEPYNQPPKPLTQETVPARPSSPKKRVRALTLTSDDEYDIDNDVAPPSISKRKRRKTTVHGPNHKFFCTWPGCRAGFTRFYDRTRHEAKHVGGGKETCRICGEELSRKDSLNRHMMKKHKNMESDGDSDQDG